MQLTAAPAEARRAHRFAFFPLGAAIVLIAVAGSVLRMAPTLVGGFPANDGGLFAAFSADIVDAGFSLPAVTAYNGLHIPFAYPPLAFLLAAGLHNLLGIDFVDLLRWIPAAAAVASLPVAALILRQLLTSNFRYVVALTTFAILPRSYIWLVGGGGLTRSIGLLFALLAIYIAIRLFRGGDPRLWLLMGALLGLAVLSHPQAGPFSIISIAILLLHLVDRARRVKVAFSVVRAMAVAAIVVMPWLIVVWTRHGLETLVSAAQTGGSPLDGLLTVLSGDITGGPLRVLSVPIMFGLFVCAMNRLWFIPIWFMALVVGDPRAGLTYAALPASVAAAIAVDDLRRIARQVMNMAPKRWSQLSRSVLRSQLSQAVLLLVLLAVGTTDAWMLVSTPGSPGRTLTPESRDAMQWVRDNTAKESTFLILTGGHWDVDAVSEWFPLLADRRSVATVQGYEWLGSGAFSHQRAQYETLQRCASDRRQACVSDWEATVGPVDYVMLSDGQSTIRNGRTCCLDLADDVASQLPGKVVLTSSNAIIIQRTVENSR